MGRCFLAALLAILLSAVVSTASLAAASLPITKGPLQPEGSWTGPTFDPDSSSGQWFRDNTKNVVFKSYSHEFHDNTPGYGGGSAGSLAIYGKVIDVTQDESQHITNFSVRARITNDTPSTSEWTEGGNSPGESTDQRQQYQGTLIDAKLAIEFAVVNPFLLPSKWLDPYKQGEIGSGEQYMYDPAYIVADNCTWLAWYGWTPGNDEELDPLGDYYAPSYDFGDILPGETVERTISFHVSTAYGIASDEKRYDAIMQSLDAKEGEGDIFSNRTTDLKIGDWLDYLAADTGDAYPTDSLRGGNVSLFHNTVPEPGSLVALCGGLVILLGFRRRSA